MTSAAPLPEPTPVPGGFHIKDLPGGRSIEVRQMLYNWRIVLANNPQKVYEAGWCYFGHGGRSMESAMTIAVLAAQVWDGEGEPLGYDKRAF